MKPPPFKRVIVTLAALVVCWLAGCASQPQGVAGQSTASFGQPALITTVPKEDYTGIYVEPDDHGRVLTLVVYEAGKPVVAWSAWPSPLKAGEWKQSMEGGTGWIHHFDLDGKPHYSENFFKGVYTHGVH